MSTKIVINQNNAAHLMFDRGLSPDMVQHGLNTLPQPSFYHFFISDVLKYIRKVSA